MSGFWTSPTGHEITGSEKDSHLQDFSVIPDGTQALAAIKSCMVVEAAATQYKPEDKYIEVVYKIVSDEFKNREVTQKIKVFNGKPEQIHRNLNLLKRLMMLCNYKPTHNNEPTNQDLAAMNGKVLGIKIAEWSMPKADGTGVLDGNWVSEVHPAKDFKCETGVKMEVTHTNSPLDSAFSRNPKGVGDDLESDIPF
jgi:hypothetical protein